MQKIIDNDIFVIYKLELELGNTGHVTNCYIIKDKNTGDGILVDPAYDASYIISILDKLCVRLKVIYLTHCHGDHIAALEGVYDKFKPNVKILIHENDKEGIFDSIKNCKYIIGVPNFIHLSVDDINTVKDKDIINVGNVLLEVIHTPGHTSGSTMLYFKDWDIILSGDTIFSDCHGRTDLKSGSKEDMKKSLDKIFSIFSNEKVYSGHGEAETLTRIKENLGY